MNLAEIRKKAIDSRKPEDREAGLVEESPELSDGAGAQELLDRIECGVAVEESPDFDFFPDTGLEESCYSETFGDEISMASDDIPLPTEAMDEMPDKVTDLPEQITPREPSLIASVSDELTAPATAVRHPAYDPLSILLAGRLAAAEGTEMPVEGETGGISDEVEEYLCFKVANEEYALSIMAIKEIIKPREVTEVPRMPRFVSGVISLRGIIIPIMDMRLRLSLPVREATGRERILVLKTSNGLCGVLVDEVIQVVRIGSSAIEGPPTILDGVDREFVMGLGRFDNRMLILLNLESILDLNVR